MSEVISGVVLMPQHKSQQEANEEFLLKGGYRRQIMTSEEFARFMDDTHKNTEE